MSDSRFADRVIAVTGAAGRLGQRVVSALTLEQGRVAALVRSSPEARLVPVGAGATVRSFPCNVTDGESVETAFGALLEEFGRLDALIHTAGGWGMTPLLDMPVSEAMGQIEVNLRSTALCFREAARIMSSGTGGALVAIASAQGADGGVAGQWAYSAAKAGVIRLVESAAAELGAHGIVARAVAPSMILYDDDAGSGVPADEIVRLCLRCALPDSDVASGSVIRAYGSGGPA